MTAISVDIVRKQYAAATAGGRDSLAISGLTFDVQEGEFVCVLGPSGCGKTTLLNLIAGLDEDYEGHIRMLGQSWEDLAYVFQTPRLLPWRTVQENVHLVAEDQSDGQGLAMGLLHAVGLDEFSGNYPGELSLGMQRRVALARAFACRPKLLLMDEPFVSLDPAAAGELRQLLRDILKERPATVIFVTHDHREAVQMADRILLLSRAPARLQKDVPVNLTAAQRAKAARIETFVAAHLQ